MTLTKLGTFHEAIVDQGTLVSHQKTLLIAPRIRVAVGHNHSVRPREPSRILTSTSQDWKLPERKTCARFRIDLGVAGLAVFKCLRIGSCLRSSLWTRKYFICSDDLLAP